MKCSMEQNPTHTANQEEQDKTKIMTNYPPPNPAGVFMFILIKSFWGLQQIPGRQEEIGYGL